MVSGYRFDGVFVLTEMLAYAQKPLRNDSCVVFLCFFIVFLQVVQILKRKLEDDTNAHHHMRIIRRYSNTSDIDGAAAASAAAASAAAASAAAAILERQRPHSPLYSDELLSHVFDR
jgi:hypothetical protein